MKFCIRLAALLLCLLLAIPAAALEADPELTLTIRYQDGETAVEGAPFRLYRVAALNEDLSLTATEPFADYRAEIRDPDTRWDLLAGKLERYVNKTGLTPDAERRTGSDGRVEFRNLTAGVYLLVSQRYRFDGKIYRPNPVIITLPSRDAEGNWIYAVTAKAKFSATEDTPIDLTVEKHWQDEGFRDKRPEQITAILLRDGTEWERVLLQEENGWRHCWQGLDPFYDWTVAEVPVEGYETVLRKPDKDGADWTIVIQNRYIPPELPQTGQLNWPVPLMASGGLILFFLGWVLYSGSRREKPQP